MKYLLYFQKRKLLSMAERVYDLVVFGATGYTGQFVAEEVTRWFSFIVNITIVNMAIPILMLLYSSYPTTIQNGQSITNCNYTHTYIYTLHRTPFILHLLLFPLPLLLSSPSSPSNSLSSPSY